MFTVKHISLSGQEELIAADFVRYTPESENRGNNTEPVCTKSPATVWVIEMNQNGERPLTGGTIFVMNEAGATVARYDLGASNVPLGPDKVKGTRLYPK